MSYKYLLTRCVYCGEETLKANLVWHLANRCRNRRKIDNATKLGFKKTSELEEMRIQGVFQEHGIKYEPMSRLENLEFDDDGSPETREFMRSNPVLEAAARLEQADVEP